MKKVAVKRNLNPEISIVPIQILKGVFPIWVPVSQSLSRIWTIATGGIVAKLVYYRVRMMGKLKDGVNPLILAIQSGARSRSNRHSRVSRITSSKCFTVPD